MIRTCGRVMLDVLYLCGEIIDVLHDVLNLVETQEPQMSAFQAAQVLPVQRGINFTENAGVFRLLHAA